LVKIYYQSGESPTITLRKWKTRNKLHNDPFSINFLKKLIRRFEKTGNVAPGKPSGRPSLKERVPAVQKALKESSASNPYGCSSTRKIAQSTGICNKSVHNILTKQLILRPYHISLHQTITEDDKISRVEFASWMLDNWSKIDQVLWSDESTFSLDGRINRHNCVIWTEENPHISTTKALHSPWVMVWIGFSTSIMSPPFFFETTVTSDSYSYLLINHIIPFLKRKKKFSSTIFQQDGAPAHFSVNVREILNQNFPKRLIGRGLDVKWPPRSPDLSPLDYWLWPLLKDRIYYQGKPDNIEQLKLRIGDEVGRITRGEMASAINNLR